MLPTRRTTFLLGVVTLATVATALPTAQAAPTPGWRIAHLLGPQPGESGPELYGVTAYDSKNAWVAGREGSRLLIKHWNGTAWQRMEVPPSLVPGSGNAVLEKVVASAPKNVWAFGTVGRAGSDDRTTFGVHWDGARWTRKTLGKNAWVNDAVAVGKRGEVWVSYGSPPCQAWRCPQRVLRFDGSSWRSVPAPGRGAYRLSSRAGTGMWATTDLVRSNTPATKAALARWDGRRWRFTPELKVAAPRGVRLLITDVVARGPKDVWASVAFQGGDGSHLSRGMLARWNGKRWNTFKVNTKDYLTDLDTDGQGGFWLTGYGDRTPLVHYRNGKATRRLAPVPSGDRAEIESLVMIPGTRSLWAVGNLTGKAAIWKHGS